jgi:hypothetical protein
MNGSMSHSHKSVFVWSNDCIRRAELVQKMVLNEIRDDFENLGQLILPMWPNLAASAD